MMLTRIYASEDGESHIVEIEVPFTTLDSLLDLPPLKVSRQIAATHVKFLAGSSRSLVDRWWPVPARQFVICLRGSLETHASDGSSCTFTPGSIAFVEDTWGKGHMNTAVSEGDVLLAFIPVPDGTSITDLAKLGS